MKLQKVTDAGQAEPVRHGRRYRDACGAAFALELVGERWALLIMRELMFGPKRFGAIRGGLPAISARVLAERLGELEAAGVVRREMLAPPASVAVYALTDWGRQADEAMLALCRWSLQSPGHDPSLHLSSAGLMMSLRALFRGGADTAGEIAVGEDLFAVSVAKGVFTVRSGAGEAAAFRLTAADARPLMQLFYGKVGLAAAEAVGLAVAGDRAAAAAFGGCFALPDKLA
ncbi:MAG: helix-turn-helix transcriptional regulator [Sphingomonadales bacterium]|nr:helix-turn-helix transcriptional regulator [Sphingomonadales bacterium]